jgi:site-specific recombinase XerD
MAADRDLPLTRVQAVMGHAKLSTTQRYLVQGSGIAADGLRKPQVAWAE